MKQNWRTRHKLVALFFHLWIMQKGLKFSPYLHSNGLLQILNITFVSTSTTTAAYYSSPAHKAGGKSLVCSYNPLSGVHVIKTAADSPRTGWKAVFNWFFLPSCSSGILYSPRGAERRRSEKRANENEAAWCAQCAHVIKTCNEKSGCHHGRSSSV